MLKPAFVAVLVSIALSCNTNYKGDKKAFDIVQQCIEQHGGNNYEVMDISFDFRHFRVHLKHNHGVYLYERNFKDSLNNTIQDILTNDSFSREINGKKQSLTTKDSNKYKEEMNALAYFALLPYKLSEPAVKLKYIGETTIENKKYDKIGVSFEVSGGGKDHGDEFCYWINKDTHTMDYLSYASGGPRFRKAIKSEKVAGITFQDYENYQVIDSTLATYDYDKAFNAGQVKLLSSITQTNYISNK